MSSIHTRFARLARLALAAAMLLAVLVPIAAPSFAAEVQLGTVTGSVVNVRASASTDGKWLMSLAAGSSVVVLGEEDGWYKISSAGVEGYMSSQYLDVADSGTASLGKGLVNGSYVCLRSQPNTSSEALTVLQKGTTVTITGVQDGWFAVTYGSFKGYMHGDYVVTVSSGTSGSVQRSASYTKGEQIVAMAKKYLGVRYVYGGSSPSTGFDCSGFTQYVYKQCGITIANRTQQYLSGTAVKYADLQPGDLVFFATRGGTRISHVGIYIGNGQLIHAVKPGTVVRIQSMEPGTYYYSTFRCARRLV